MALSSGKTFRNTVICAALTMLVVSIGFAADTTHVVPLSSLQAKQVAASQVRQENIQKVRDFIALPVAQSTLRDAHVDSGKVQDAVSQLDDQELAQLSARADKAQKDFAAGYLTTRDIALIILGVVLIIVIIIVAR